MQLYFDRFMAKIEKKNILNRNLSIFFPREFQRFGNEILLEKSNFQSGRK